MTNKVVVDVDNLIIKMLTETKAPAGMTAYASKEQIEYICKTAMDLFRSQPPMLEIGPPVRVVGDTHGQFDDLLRLLHLGGFPPVCNYLFLGDYVDRGKQSLEVMVLLLLYKIKYPENVFLLRGNHECMAINRIYGFYEECRRRYHIRIWKVFQDMFNVMPLCALIGDRILCMHGGISPHIQSWDQLRSIQRPVNPDGTGLVMDLLWADPDESISGWMPSSRGISNAFGSDVLKKFCSDMNIDLVARAHQVVLDGYKFFGDKHLVTIFSAPLYCGEFDNAAGVMIVDKDLLLSFQILRPPPRTSQISSPQDRTVLNLPPPQQQG